MKIVTWNLNNRKTNQAAWDKLFELDADLVLLSEVNFVPDDLRGYDFHFEPAMYKNGNFQTFKTGLLCRGSIGDRFELIADDDWITQAIADYPGNFVCRKVTFNNGKQFNVISVHMPSWQFPHEKYTDDISRVQLPNYPKVYMSELLWAALQNILPGSEGVWIVGGDFNTSEFIGSKRQRQANLEAIARLERLGLIETVRRHNGGPVPSWRPIQRNREMIHQLDHLYVSNELLRSMQSAKIGARSEYIDSGFSDHLPILGQFQG